MYQEEDTMDMEGASTELSKLLDEVRSTVIQLQISVVAVV